MSFPPANCWMSSSRGRELTCLLICIGFRIPPFLPPHVERLQRQSQRSTRIDLVAHADQASMPRFLCFPRGLCELSQIFVPGRLECASIRRMRSGGSDCRPQTPADDVKNASTGGIQPKIRRSQALLRVLHPPLDRDGRSCCLSCCSARRETFRPHWPAGPRC